MRRGGSADGITPGWRRSVVRLARRAAGYRSRGLDFDHRSRRATER